MDRDIGSAGFILIVNRDPVMRQAVSGYFSDHNFHTSCLSDWSEVTCTGTTGPSLIIMDQPRGLHEGLDRLRSIRSKSDTPVIVTSGRADEVDPIVNLELGADDFIVRPSPRELLARARAILRRRQACDVKERDPEAGGYLFDGWRLDRHSRRLVDRNGTPVRLSNGEYTLLLAFLEAPQRPLAREHLLRATRVHEDIFDRSVDVQVLRLRRKLERDPNTPRVIRSERGVGYVFALPVERY